MSVGLNMFQSLGAIIAVYYVGVFLCEKIAVLRQYCTGCRRLAVRNRQLCFIHAGHLDF